MEHGGVEQDTMMYNAAVSVWEEGGQLAQALQVLGKKVANRIVMNTLSYSAVVRACLKGGQRLWDVELLVEIANGWAQRSIITNSAAVSTCTKAVNGCTRWRS